MAANDWKHSFLVSSPCVSEHRLSTDLHFFFRLGGPAQERVSTDPPERSPVF